MNRKLIRLSEQFLIMSGLQVFVLNYVKTSVVPSFFLVWLLILTWEGNREIALVLAVVTGLFYDVISRGVPGVSGVIFLVVVYASCFLKTNSIPGRVAGAFGFSLFYFLAFMFERDRGFLWGTPALFKYSLLFALYNALILLAIELGMRKLRWKKKEYLSI